MRKIILLTITILSVIGCAQLRQAKVDFQDCWNDPTCREEALRKSEDLGSKAAVISAVSPIPGTPAVVRPIATGVGLLVFLAAGGRALRKKKEENPA